MGSVYKGSFVNTQVDYTDNSPNEQTFYVTITDLSTTELEYGLSFLAVPIGGGQQSMTVNWASLPIDTTSLIIGYSLAGVGSYTDITVNNPAPTDFYTWNVAVGNYDIRIQVVRSAGPTETYYIYYLEYQLEMSEAPIVLQTVDNSEDKFTPIKSKSCTISVFTNDDVNAMTFAAGGDTQYKVEVAVNAESEIIYTGWLSLSDLGQTFQPDPNILTLTATDGIAFLRDIPLTGDDNIFLTNNHQLIRYISWALKKTGIELEIWIQMNLLEEDAIYDYPEYHFYNTVYLNAQTFEQEIGTLENCYSILEKILGEFCILSQQKNVWFIKSVDEANYSSFRICKFNSDGQPIEYITETFTKSIGSTQDIAFMNDDARLSLIRPFKSVIQNFNYEYPAEIIPNLAFDRGVFITDISPTEKSYKFDNWTVIQGVPGFYAAPTSTATIRRVFDSNDYEKDRYVAITPKVGPLYSLDLITYARSEAFYLQERDKFTVSVDWRLPAATGLTGTGEFLLLEVVLYGDDGSWWVLGTPTVGSTEYTWYNTSNWTLNGRKPEVPVNFNNDLTEWQSINWDAPPAPVTGKLYLWMHQFNQLVTTSDNVDIWYSNLDFTYTPYINGSYQKYTGQSHISEQSIDTIASRDNVVFMSDGPRKGINGSMMKKAGTELAYSGNAIFANGNAVTLDGFQTPYFNLNDYVSIINTTSNNGTYRIIEVVYSNALNKTTLGFEQATVSEIDATTTINVFTYELVESFYDSILWPGGGGPSSAFYPYGQHQNQAVWNQFNRVFSAFEATCDGLDTDKTDEFGLPDLPDLMHLYYQTDTHPATINKEFMVLHYEQDTDNCQWNLYMVEVGDTSISKSYSGHSFKYTQK